MEGNPTRGIRPSDTTAIECEECKSQVFQEAYFLRKASKLLTGQSTDQVIPIPTFRCADCGHINKEFIPKF